MSAFRHFAVVQRFSLTPVVLALLAAGLPTGAVSASSPHAAPLVHDAAQAHHFELAQVLGTSLDVWLLTDTLAQAQAIRQAMLDEINRLDLLLSIWRPDSHISQLNRRLQQQDVLLDGQHAPELCAVIAACEQWQQRSGGAFNARMGAHLTPARAALPLPDALTRPLTMVQGQWLIPQGVQWAPDALAKGHIIDRALAVARAQGALGVMIDIGGDVRVWGRSPFERYPSGQRWPIGLQAAHSTADNAPVHQVVSLHNAALAMSGQGWRDQQGQSHLRSPHTGQPAQHPRVAAIAPTAQDADALATALSVLSLADGQRLVTELIQNGLVVAAQVQDAQGQLHELGDFAAWLQPTATARTDGLPADGRWLNIATNATSPAATSTAYRASLGLTLPKISSGEYHAPYVAVWITDSKKNLVRTLHIWGNKPKWMDSNYVWWRRYGRKIENLATVAKPSRQPGQYQLEWDGKDERGQIVPDGQYLLHIEAAREHGGHTLQSLPLSVGPKGQQTRLPAQGELGELVLIAGPRA